MRSLILLVGPYAHPEEWLRKVTPNIAISGQSQATGPLKSVQDIRAPCRVPHVERGAGLRFDMRASDACRARRESGSLELGHESRGERGAPLARESNRFITRFEIRTSQNEGVELVGRHSTTPV